MVPASDIPAVFLRPRPGVGPPCHHSAPRLLEKPVEDALQVVDVRQRHLDGGADALARHQDLLRLEVRHLDVELLVDLVGDPRRDLHLEVHLLARAQEALHRPDVQDALALQSGEVEGEVEAHAAVVPQLELLVARPLVQPLPEVHHRVVDGVLDGRRLRRQRELVHRPALHAAHGGGVERLPGVRVEGRLHQLALARLEHPANGQHVVHLRRAQPNRVLRRLLLLRLRHRARTAANVAVVKHPLVHAVHLAHVGDGEVDPLRGVHQHDAEVDPLGAQLEVRIVHLRGEVNGVPVRHVRVDYVQLVLHRVGHLLRLVPWVEDDADGGLLPGRQVPIRAVHPKGRLRPQTELEVEVHQVLEHQRRRLRNHGHALLVRVDVRNLLGGDLHQGLDDVCRQAHVAHRLVRLARRHLALQVLLALAALLRVAADGEGEGLLRA
eukprot:1195843-Prorocentrum_minimum.AAC.5